MPFHPRPLAEVRRLGLFRRPRRSSWNSSSDDLARLTAELSRHHAQLVMLEAEATWPGRPGLVALDTHRWWLQCSGALARRRRRPQAAVFFNNTGIRLQHGWE
ncbi:hypothetical protein [Streptomyces noursei]|uniref:hypothetical protein n=1 Tax=Streptomyces noursei TaxID=1971 RepID=UPI0021A6D6DD|nr:hypothetical protein [Streptomyces noursei]UWS69813.1 hypothetical protein N1H47_00030 [Streptomyces noursei]UWS76966.1 hypothetical protein N1H47_40490 [Streptomyces noursei]